MAFKALLDPKKKKAALEAARRGDLEFFRKKAAPDDRIRPKINPTPDQTPVLSKEEQEKLNTELFEAAWKDDLGRAIDVLDKGADVNANPVDDSTALMVANRAGNGNIVLLLISRNADVNAKDNLGRTPLMYACNGSHTAIIDYLISCGADVNARDNEGNTVIAHAAGVHSADIVSLLKLHGAIE